jgi:hypothetical protein
MRQGKPGGKTITGFAALFGFVAAMALANSAMAGPVINYNLLKLIPVPPSDANVQPGGAFTSFDISFFDPGTNADYVADRSNAAVDIFSAASLTLIGRATGFTGQQATTSVSGPDGVLVTPAAALFAGNGDSTLRSFIVSNPAAPIPLFPPINTGGSFRVDEMAYSPTANLVLAANNADNPAFGTLVNASTGAIVHGNIVVPNAVGLEQPVWNPNTGTFFISVPSFGGGNNPGGVAEIKTDGTIGRIYDFSTFGIASCSPTGLALGASGNLMVGCGNKGTQTVVLNPAGSGSIVKLIAQISGSDALWYDPASGKFFVTGVDATAGRAFDVISDSNYAVLQSVPLPPVNAHSITVDPFNGFVFVPLEGTTAAATDNLCPLGCIAVFAQTVETVPEPPSLAVMLVAFAGFAGLSWLRRARNFRQSGG